MCLARDGCSALVKSSKRIISSLGSTSDFLNKFAQFSGCPEISIYQAVSRQYACYCIIPEKLFDAAEIYIDCLSTTV